ncbi:MAG: putative DNA binding domain-containing protein [Clostridiales bacterium]|nr:putative DNA binding domain-containing protein [Clostridiales bacterium]
MTESQNIEWKESWQDDYLKWICGYANASGGTLFIGIDDHGNVKGIKNAKNLLEKIPNQITDTMGIIADVNLRNKDGLDYLEIKIEKYPTMISLHGVYYYRSGSTMRTITGKELDKAYESCNPIQISIYEDHMYIWNEGKMPEGLDSTEKLFEKHSSKPYNPKLANTFFKSGMIEAWGRGFDKIRKGCEEYSGPLPKYQLSGGVMVLCNACDLYLQLMRKNNKEILLKKDDPINGPINDPINDGEFGDNIDLQTRLLTVIHFHPEWTRKKYSEALNVSDTTVKRLLSKLQKENIVIHEGSRKKGKWVIVNREK